MAVESTTAHPNTTVCTIGRIAAEVGLLGAVVVGLGVGLTQVRFNPVWRVFAKLLLNVLSSLAWQLVEQALVQV